MRTPDISIIDLSAETIRDCQYQASFFGSLLCYQCRYLHNRLSVGLSHLRDEAGHTQTLCACQSRGQIKKNYEKARRSKSFKYFFLRLDSLPFFAQKGGEIGNGMRREDTGKAYRFKIESNQINLQASLVMEKYAKFQLGKTRCEAATRLQPCFASMSAFSLSLSHSLCSTLQVHS